MVGNNPNYSRQDILRALFRLTEPKSRQQLAEELELGEGTVRSILNILKENKLLSSTNQGHSLSKHGKESIACMQTKIHAPKKVELGQYKKYKCMAAVVKDHKAAVGYHERDAAVKHGAEGALLLRKDLKIGQHYFKELEGKFSIGNDDVLVICFAKDFRTAENACLAVGEEMKNKLF